MEVTRTSIVSGITRTKELDITTEQLTAWENGINIQNAMPHLSADDREFVLTGIIAEEWDRYFEEAEESPYDTAFSKPEQGLLRQELVTYVKRNGVTYRETVTRSFFDNDYSDTKDTVVLK